MAATLTDKQIRYAGRMILTYRPLPAADAFHRSQAKHRFLFGGNRSGKSQACIGFDLCSFALGLHPHRKTPKNATIWAAAGPASWRARFSIHRSLAERYYDETNDSIGDPAVALAAGARFGYANRHWGLSEVPNRYRGGAGKWAVARCHHVVVAQTKQPGRAIADSATARRNRETVFRDRLGQCPLHMIGIQPWRTKPLPKN